MLNDILAIKYVRSEIQLSFCDFVSLINCSAEKYKG